MRKLVTIRQADKVEHHPNADALDLVEIGGWTVITKRDEFKAGDLGVLVAAPEFHVYNVFVLDGAKCSIIEPTKAKAICDGVGLKYVPVLFKGKLRDFADSFEKLKELSDGPGMNAGVKREGIVVKSLGVDNYFSFKQISETYLLNEK